MTSAIVWFRQDMRLEDHPALYKALSLQKPLLCVYIDDPQSPYEQGGAVRWWMHYALKDLHDSLKEKGNRLILRQGNPLSILEDISKETNAEHLYWNRQYFPYSLQRDTRIKSFFKEKGLDVQSFKASLLKEPQEVSNKEGGIYKVYSPFRRMAESQGLEDTALPCPDRLPPAIASLNSDNIETLFPLPQNPNWAQNMEPLWDITEKGALKRTKEFAQNALEDYKSLRDFPAKPYVSRLSPYLARGMITPRKIMEIIKDYPVSKGKTHFISELLWREFSYYLLFHFPYMETTNFRPEWDEFPWENNKAFLTAWKKGQTGIPIIDASMRELRQTGYIHNRTRMLVGSYLVKHLLIDWREGEAWFHDNLVDYDPASNCASWQWVAGSGADAAPYFRIFNPVLQSKKFDADGEYIKQYVPEMKALDGKDLHAPWEVAPFTLKYKNIALGENYPYPLVDLQKGRDKALELYKQIKKAKND